MFAVITYANDIFGLSNSKLSPESSSIVIGVLQLLGSIVASTLIDKSGRKVGIKQNLKEKAQTIDIICCNFQILLIISCTIISLGMTVIGIYFYLIHLKYDLPGLGWIPAAALSLAVASFSVGIAPIPFILPSELIAVKVL